MMMFGILCADRLLNRVSCVVSKTIQKHHQAVSVQSRNRLWFWFSRIIKCDLLEYKANSAVAYSRRCAGNTGSALRVGFPQLCLNDSPAGVRHADNVTAFPDGITVGATFDKSLMYQRGVAIGKENRGKGVHVWLGPVVGPIGRKPKGGRNWEGFGADPVLQAVGARETIKGVQEQGVIATIKHFIGNEQEMYRMYNPFQYAYSSNIGEYMHI